jgi:hypothetical protein
MKVPVSNDTSIQEIAAAVNELYDALQWQDPTNNRAMGQIEPGAQYLRTGQIAYADGTNWNPNSQGEGYYRYTGSAWVKLLETDDAFTTSIDADKLDGHHWSEIPTVALTKYFESSQQTITSAGALTIAHGLTIKPKLIQCVLICQTAEQGYSIGDELFVSIKDDDGANVQGVSMVVDTTNLNVRFSSSATCYLVSHKTSGIRAALINGNWKVIFRAWA